VVDLHAHVLPGLDDGPATLAEAVEMLSEVVATGVTTVVATPHVSDRYPVTPDQISDSLATLKAALAERSLRLELLPGAEVDSRRLATLEEQEIASLTLGGSGRYLLVELPWEGVNVATGKTLQRLASLGVRPVIAHPERYAYVQESPAILASLTESGALMQVTVTSLVGGHGRAAAATARILLEHRHVHVLASDMHGPRLNRAPLADAAPALADPALLEWLTYRVPHAVVHGDDPPARPESRRGFRLR
jgi:protein-tyrosine phosphatase